MRCPVCHSILYDHRGRGNHPDVELQGPPLMLCLNGHFTETHHPSKQERKVKLVLKGVMKKCALCPTMIEDKSQGTHRKYCKACKRKLGLKAAAAYRKKMKKHVR